MKEFTIGVNDSGQRLDKFLQKAVKKLPKSMMYKAIRTKNIKLNSKRCKPETMLCEGDVLRLFINDDFFSEDTKSVDKSFLNAPNSLDILYEDENILVVNKSLELACHTDNSNKMDTLIDRVKHYLYEKGDYNPSQEQSFTPALCNRLDKNTCGIVIAAKNAKSLREMNERIRLGEIKKLYLCLCAKNSKVNVGTGVAYHKKDSIENKVYISDVIKDGYKKIITKINRISEFGNNSLCEVELVTGRTHQIRAYLSHIGLPILGDSKYGISGINGGRKFPYQALCAYKLRFEFEGNGDLNYLKGREFELTDIWFLKDKFCG